MLEAVQVHEVQHLADAGLDFALAFAVHAHAERHVVVHVQVREKRVFLKDGVDFPPVGRKVRDSAAVEIDVAGVRPDEAADDPQSRGLAAAGRAEQRDKLPVPEVQVEVPEHGHPVERDRDALERNDGCSFHFHASPLR